MKINYTLLLIFSSFFCIQSNAQNVWRHRACFPTTTAGNAAFALDGKGYVVAGGTMPVLSDIDNQVWEYDPATDGWMQKNNYPESVSASVAFVINDTAYVGLGEYSSGSFSTHFYKYNQTTDQWTQLRDFPGYGRYTAMAFAVDGKGYVGCGFNGGELNDFYEYDPGTNTWTQKGNFPGGPRQSGYGVTVNNTGFMGFGLGTTGNMFTDSYKYNSDSDTWTAVANFPGLGREGCTSMVLDDTSFYVASGNYYRIRDFAECWRYNIPSNSWVQVQGFDCLASPRFVICSFVVNGHGFVPGGCNYTYTQYFSDFLEFGPPDTAFTEQVNALGNDTAYCGSFNRTLTVSDSCAVWSTGAIGSSINVNSAGTYWVRMNDSCGVSADTIRITQADSITISTNKDTICSNDSAQICATSGLQSYQWNNGATTTCIYTNQAGNYYVTASYLGGCMATSNTVLITVLPLPQGSIDASGDTITYHGDGVFIQWYHNGDSIPGANSSQYIATQPGEYWAFVTNGEGCGDTVQFPTIQSIGIIDITAPNINVYPNPLNTGNWIIVGDENIIGAEAEIFDESGRLVYHSKINSSKFEIELNAAKGVYTLRINNGDKYEVKKLVRL